MEIEALCGSENVDRKAVLRAYRIITEYNKLKDVSPELQNMFLHWLISKNNEREKHIALEAVFYEFLD